MPALILKALDCERTHSLSVDFTKLEVSVDGHGQPAIKKTMSNRERATLNNTFTFQDTVKIELMTAGTIKLNGTLTIRAAALPHRDTHGRRGLHRGKAEFNEAAAEYRLWYEVIPDGMSAEEFHAQALLGRLSLRQTLGRMGRGALTSDEYDSVLGETKYRCSETISVRDIFAQHRPQDQSKGNTSSVRQWVARHCNVWGEEAVIPINQLADAPNPITLGTAGNPKQWRAVKDERSCILAGFVVRSRMSDADFGIFHSSRDFLFDVIPSPAFSYLLAYTAKSSDINTPNALSVRVPRSHNEWESGSMPLEWRPEEGEYVTLWGRHVFDLGHLPMATEIHPPHTIVRERTASDGTFNRVRIGMGFSGGFIGSISATVQDDLKERWQAEFGGFLPGLNDGRHERNWPTNLKKHPLHIKLFPPEPRPTPHASLRARVIDWKIIQIKTSDVDLFLKRCRGSASSTEPLNRAFADWFPTGLEDRPAAFRPQLTSRATYFDLTIDLSNTIRLPVAYFAVIDIDWQTG